MKVDSKKNENVLTVHVAGNIDTVTAPDLESELRAQWDDVTELILDFSDVNFISSAGIRVLLCAYKQMQDRGKMTLKNVHEDVKEVFEIAGLGSIFHFE